MITIDGTNLTAETVVRVARERSAEGAWVPVQFATESRTRLQQVREYVEREWLVPNAPPIYGFNTGLGKLKDSAISVENIERFQQMLVHSHSAGVGEPLPEDVIRATLLLRINAFARGCSAPRIEVVDRLLSMLNTGIHPVIPCKGSVGASGDLAPLAYLAGVLVGHPNAEAFFRGERMSAQDAFRAAGIEPTFKLEAKDGLAVINGSTVSLAIAVLTAHDSREILVDADIALALSLEAMRGELAAFEADIHDVRPHPGQIRTAANVRVLTAGSSRCTDEARAVTLPDESRVRAQTIPARVQDAYSLRCASQVHGPVRDALDYIDRILGVELNSATDNPLVFPTDDGYRVLSGGNFHGQYIAQAMDLLAMIMTDLGSISERRIYRMLDPTMSYGLPSNLIATLPGVNTGYSIAHCSMAALVTENKSLCWPAGADSIPTKSNQEDHVSNSTWAARKARMIVSNVAQIVGTEYLISAQALDVTRGDLGSFALGAGTSVAYDRIRDAIPAALDGDRWLHADLGAALDLVVTGSVRAAVQSAVGNLA
ncbi:MAG: aromatic amino acid lyase [Spirochaetaceae bacterium]|nr:MAG: aromatic amino acid lyase [Spirochaetaceae bacterium]